MSESSSQHDSDHHSESPSQLSESSSQLPEESLSEIEDGLEKLKMWRVSEKTRLEMRKV